MLLKINSRFANLHFTKQSIRSFGASPSGKKSGVSSERTDKEKEPSNSYPPPHE